MTIGVKTKQWGNSIGVIIPRTVVEELGIVPGEEVIVDFKKKHNVLKELFGSIRFKRKPQEIVKEVRKELEGNLI